MTSKPKKAKPKKAGRQAAGELKREGASIFNAGVIPNIGAVQPMEGSP